jgi:hypothetical protein
MKTYYYLVASQRFLLEEEPLDEVLKERTRHYHEQEKEIDFWLVKQPAFLEAPQMAEVKQACPSTLRSHNFYESSVHYLVKAALRICQNRRISGTLRGNC